MKINQVGGSRVQDYRFYNASQDTAQGKDCPYISHMAQDQQVALKQQSVTQYYPFPDTPADPFPNTEGAVSVGSQCGGSRFQHGGSPTPLPREWFHPNPNSGCGCAKQPIQSYGAEHMFRPVSGCGCQSGGGRIQQKGGFPTGAPLYITSSRQQPLKYNFNPSEGSGVVFDPVTGCGC